MNRVVVESLSDDPVHNRAILQQALDRGPGAVTLPPGSWQLSGGGLRLEDGRSLTGAVPAADGVGTSLESSIDTTAPLLHVVGCDVSISDVNLTVPSTYPGEHDGDRGTAITVGQYLYDRPATWIENIRLERIRIQRSAVPDGQGDPANNVALMGAIRHVALSDITVTGGGTGVAVHWGAVASSVRDVIGPSYHPHHIDIFGLRVTDAFEGFYLSSVHHVRVHDATMEDVDIGFRMLPGDNTVRFATEEAAASVSSHIDIADCRVTWRGSLYGVRVAGWGRSEVDGAVTAHPYAMTCVRRCHITTLPLSAASSAPKVRRAALVLEDATGVVLEDVEFEGEPVDLVRSDGAAVVHGTFTLMPQKSASGAATPGQA